ncbi:hypothetical protein MLD38_003056 [Melastoma candidum]|uniref:Uncharacterized protein n=1 Tax=Melastoma candidum TaxID=119954 RepID=A0ACB9S561_9MYRT|nr:hypothetical protein MLD38_003056 [Melastoma candidum]
MYNYKPSTPPKGLVPPPDHHHLRFCRPNCSLSLHPNLLLINKQTPFLLSFIFLMEHNHGSSSEESGWTTYLRDFSGGYNFSSTYCSSLVSDAASHARRPSPIAGDKIKAPKKVNLVKKTTRRAGDVTHEDPLEDTASSPANSPRIIDRVKGTDRPGHANQKHKGKDGGGGKWEKSGLGCEVDDGRRSMDRKEGNSSDLKKRGLCLVSLSSLFMG